MKDGRFEPAIFLTPAQLKSALMRFERSHYGFAGQCHTIENGTVTHQLGYRMMMKRIGSPGYIWASLRLSESRGNKIPRWWLCPANVRLWGVSIPFPQNCRSDCFREELSRRSDGVPHVRWLSALPSDRPRCRKRRRLLMQKRCSNGICKHDKRNVVLIY